MELRPSSTLTIPQDLILPKADALKNYMYLYLGKYQSRTSKTVPFFARLWMAPLFPNVVADSEFGTSVRGVRAANDIMQKKVPAGLLTLRKVNDPSDPHFYASIPVFAFNARTPEALTNLVGLFAGKVGPEVDAHNAQSNLAQPSDSGGLTQRIISVDKVLDANPTLTSDQRINLRNCLLQERIVSRGGQTVIFLDFKITKGEAQQLAVTPWLELRPIDLYPLVLQWVQTGFGSRAAVKGQKRVKPSAAAFSLSKISHTLPKDQTSVARTNQYGLCIDFRGNEAYIPANLNNVTMYEDKFTQAGTREGSSDFSLLSLDDETASLMDQGKDVLTKLPKNTPVLVDWLNSRYSYTQVDGMLRVQDISRFRALDDSHAVTIMSRRLFSSESLHAFEVIADAVGYSKSLVLGTPKDLGTFDNLTDAAGKPVSDANIDHLKRSMSDVGKFFDVASRYYLSWEEQTEIRWLDIQPQGWGPFRAVYNWIKGLADAALQNTQVLYTKYSVTWSMRHVASAVMIAEYCKDVPALKARDAASRSAAVNQKVDPNWEMESLPMADGLAGFLPHQKKVRNLLKDSPDFAILPVQAGGGKSPLIVTDVLLEIKNNRSAPYLILCPPHLVPQYVSEINHFTKGKLNVVPVTSRAIMVNGMERLEKIIASAPRNLVVVASYDVLRYKPKGRMSTVCYGTTTIETYPVVSFLKQFGFKYVACDESHFLKNDSARSRAANALIVDIPKKRMASGTMAHDSPSDLAIQIGMLDPTLLGSREAFNFRYGEEFRGDRVIKWKGGASNAAKLIFNDIKKRVVVAGAMRKEWAAVLPKVIAKYIPVELSPKQQEVYAVILEDVIRRLREKAATNPTIAKFFEKYDAKIATRKGDGEDGDGGEDEDGGDGGQQGNAEDTKKEEDLDENEGEALEKLLSVHLARLEQFVTAPAKDPLGDKMLTGDDRMSPKVAKVAERLRRYIKDGWEERDPKTGVATNFKPINGKVLIFCNYIESAEAIFEQMPDDLKKLGILYRAKEKVETGAAFENDDNLRWMVGVSQSMDTGLNLQFCQALIRVETVWNPGTLEQGNSRLNRPEFKKNLDRDRIYFDTIVANRTIDITKASRLISKVITVGKFDNQESHHYDEVPDVDVISMSLESITLMNDWDGDLMNYLEAYRDFNIAQEDDYAEYRRSQGWPEQMTTEARAKLIQNFERAPDPKDAMRLGTNLYIPGSTIPHADKLGLIRLDLFLQAEQYEDEMEEDESDDDETTGEEVSNAKEELYKSLVDVPCYTDNGVGHIMLVSTGKVPRVVVGFPDGSVGNKFRTSCVWVPKDTKLKDLPNVDVLMAKEVGMPRAAEIEDATPTHVRFTSRGLKRVAEQKQVEKVKVQKVKEKPTKDELSIVLHFVATNGFLGLRYVTTGEDDRAAKALQAIGFRPSPEHVRARLKSGLMLKNLLETWTEKGFVPDTPVTKGQDESSTFFEMYRMLQQKLHRDHLSVYQMAKTADIANFYRQEFRPTSKQNVIKPYPLFQDRKAYIALPMTGQAGSRQAIRVRVPGITWEHPEPELTFFSSKLKVSEKVAEILSLGIQIINLDELRREQDNIIAMKVRKAPKED